MVRWAIEGFITQRVADQLRCSKAFVNISLCAGTAVEHFMTRLLYLKQNTAWSRLDRQKKMAHASP